VALASVIGTAIASTRRWVTVKLGGGAGEFTRCA
jgi:hypothetical protein